MIRLVAVVAMLSLTQVISESNDLETNIGHAVRAAEAALKSHELDIEKLQDDAMKRIETMQENIDQALEMRTKLDTEAVAWNRQQIDNLILRLEEVASAEQKRRQMEKNSTHAQLIDDTVAKLKDEAEAELKNAALKVIKEEVDKIDVDALTSPTCLTTSASAKQVEQAFYDFYVKDEIGKLDLLQTPGTKIIHQFTSNTYTPASSWRLGDMHRIIPEDWLGLLPTDWPEWEIPRLIPDHVWHSLGLSGETAPPEAILQDSVVPGSCWPSTRPIVTIELASQAVITSVSIDHVSGSILKDRSSAPKKIRFVGYAPCSENCKGLAFDPNTQTFFTEAVYDLEAISSVQTFAVENSPLRQPNGDGSCSTTKAQCEAPDLTTAAIAVEVTENWGNPNYTCLYRVRVHGDLVF